MSNTWLLRRWGVKIRVRVEVLEVVKNQALFQVEAWDHQDKIGEGTHKRAVVAKARFMERVMGKTMNNA